jgi:hypothetical protein
MSGGLRVYIYKITVDDGGAPCVHGGVWSLAICKPRIRSVAQEGDVILGFSGNSLYENNSLVYIAKVTQRLDGRKYFRDKYASRPDCVYEWDGRRFTWRSNAKFHENPANLAHDLGQRPEYKRASVLLSEGEDNFRYFRDKCPMGYKAKYPRLKYLIETLGQGHRVNFREDLKEELRGFMGELWQVRYRYREPIIKRTPCRDSCEPADEKYACGDC